MCLPAVARTVALFGMDAAHEADLARILENRRRRGVSAVHRPASMGEVFVEDAVNVRGPAVEGTFEGADTYVEMASPQHFYPSAKALPAPRPAADVFFTRAADALPLPREGSSAAHDASTMSAIMEEQRQLRREHAAQSMRVEEMNRTMERNIDRIIQAMGHGAVSSKSNPPVPHSPPNDYVRGPQSTLINAPREPIQAVPARASNGSRGCLPPPLVVPRGPLAAKPSATAHLDLKSAMAIMKVGEWFIKWDGVHVQAAARYVWYDYTRSCLYWGPEKFSRSALSGFIALEDVASVSTDQMTEFDGEVDRLFFLLVIHTPQRSLYLATEKRSKLDCWYEALTIISLYNRMSRSRGNTKSLSSD